MPDNSLSEKSKDALELLAKEITEIKNSLWLGTKSLTPLNYKEEMDEFFSSASHSPIYVYNKPELPNITEKIDSIKVKVLALKIPEDLKEQILEFLDDQNRLYLTKLTIGQKDFSDNAHLLFDWGTDRLDILLTNPPKIKFNKDIKHKLTDASYIKKRFEKALKSYGITSFKVNINYFSPHIINVGRQTINIGNEIRRFECNVDRLVVHEIESHVLQMENTKNSPTRLSEFTKYGNQHLYGEGLAIYNEIAAGKITQTSFEIYLNRIHAVRLLHKSFREIFETLAPNLGDMRAFVVTYRVKRGMADTSLAGGFPKDASYLLGYHEIENLIAENYPHHLLYATKSPVLSLLLDKYGLLDKDKIITPKF